MTNFFSILALIVTVIANSQSFKMLSIDEQFEDVEFIKTELEKLHPGIYTYQSEAEFEDGFELLKANLQENKNIFQFYNRLVPVINKIGCGHTTSKIPPKDLKRIQRNKHYLPIEVKIIENRIYISKVLTQNKDLVLGSEILSLDGVTATEYIKTNLNRYPSDGRIVSRKYQSLEKHFSLDYSKFNDTSEHFNVEVDYLGERKTILVAGIDYKDFTSKISQSRLEAMEFEIIDSLSTGIMTIRDSKSEKLFNNFLKNSFAQIRINKINNLIVDVRYDGFNRDSDGAELFSYLITQPFQYYDALEVTKNYDVPKAIRWLAKYPIEEDSLGNYYWKTHPQLEEQSPKSKAFLGNVFVLTDGFTFSATSEFSSKIKSSKRGLIVGRETGGSYYGNNSGGMLRKVLPNSGIIVYVPPIHYTMSVQDLGNYERGVLPDIHVASTISAIMLNQDLIKKTALDAIQAEK